MFPPVFQTLKASTAVKNIVGTNPPRVYEFGHAPQRPDNLPLTDPYITWFDVSVAPENQLSGTPGTDRIGVQIDSWHQTLPGCKALAIAVRDACEGVAHMTQAFNQRDPDTHLYRVSQTFDWFVNRTY